MVEVPEHLLKRSKERRAALGLGGGETSPATSSDEPAPASAAPAAATPAPAAPARAKPPEPKAPEPPKPDPIYVQAAKQRQRLPWWSMPVFAALPFWGWIFLRTLTPPESTEVDPLVAGETLYTENCASCHQADGSGGGTAPALDHVDETWPDFRDHMLWVHVGSSDWPGQTYGPENRSKTGGMPAFSSLTDQEVAQIVLYERQTFSEIDVAAGEEEIGRTPEDEPVTESQLLQIASGELTWAEIGVGEQSADAGFAEEDLEDIATGPGAGAEEAGGGGH